MWMTFCFFSVGLIPAVYLILRPKQTGATSFQNEAENYDACFGYIPGVRDFDSTYFASKPEAAIHINESKSS